MQEGGRAFMAPLSAADLATFVRLLDTLRAGTSAAPRPSTDVAATRTAARPSRKQGDEMIRKLSLTAAAAVLAASPVLADTYVIDKSHSEAGFQVRHLMSKVRGHFNDYAGTVTVRPRQAGERERRVHDQGGDIDTANETATRTCAARTSSTSRSSPRSPSRAPRSRPRARTSTTSRDPHHPRRGQGSDAARAVPRLRQGSLGQRPGGLLHRHHLNRKDFGIVWNKTLDSGGALLGDEVWVSINLETTRRRNGATAQVYQDSPSGGTPLKPLAPQRAIRVPG
jgi:polyisoprenoid-binding protein YceI